MSDVYRSVSSRLRLLEKLELVIPGYRGYKEKELRREADRLIRSYLLSKLEPAYRDFKGAMKVVAATGDPSLAATYNEVQAVFDRVVSKLKTMSYGYTGFFDAVKIEEKELDKMLELDWSLASSVDKVVEKARAVAAAEPSKVSAALNDLRGELLAFEDLIVKRENAIKGIG
ncbi:hypothetical protein [Thermofilum pendens]|uniref:Uncharacterized protein n=1 Tax=Thermofilum pendens (strain DSM 2475 / Hrk 5) TaxID=368408 RepID=A1RZ04_THEPD|nr:hypothetical protein [Thermofilum pendens]ABL78434.1 conserved hypothetical protein [Thermofilum pendens Hrk 5]